jgi:hypothetical protein
VRFVEIPASQWDKRSSAPATASEPPRPCTICGQFHRPEISFIEVMVDDPLEPAAEDTEGDADD